MEKLYRQDECLEVVVLIRMCSEEPFMLLMLCVVLIIIKYWIFFVFFFVLKFSTFFFVGSFIGSGNGIEMKEGN